MHREAQDNCYCLLAIIYYKVFEGDVMKYSTMETSHSSLPVQLAEAVDLVPSVLRPTGQVVQLTLPSSLLYSPIAHGWHGLSPVLEYSPAGHNSATEMRMQFNVAWYLNQKVQGNASCYYALQQVSLQVQVMTLTHLRLEGLGRTYTVWGKKVDRWDTCFCIDSIMYTSLCGTNHTVTVLINIVHVLTTIQPMIVSTVSTKLSFLAKDGQHSE